MVLINKTAKVDVSTRVKYRYLEMGYEISQYFCPIHCIWKVKNGTIIDVKIKDLPKNSHAIIKYKCDNCGEVYETSFAGYNNNHIGELDLCAKCSYKSGKEHHNWNGGKYIGKNGYVYLSDKSLEHRNIMEEYLCRELETHEEVHHINGIKTDNRIDNLQLLTKSEHTRLHWNQGDFEKRRVAITDS